MRNVPITKKLFWNLTGKRIVTFTFIHESKSDYPMQEQFPNSVTKIEMNHVPEDAPFSICRPARGFLDQFRFVPATLLGWRVDLTPISKCKKLQSLYLERNDILDIDLQPLENCEKLETISLRHNKLRSIDLTPLKSCTKLREVYLDYNQLDSIDLSPLASCTTLRKISLRKNQLRTIDTQPLSKCPYLEELDIEHNNLTTVDLAPLSACHSLSSLGLIDGNSLNLSFSASAWAPLRAIAAGSLNQIQTQCVLFNNLHLLNFGMIDSHLLNEISSIPSDTPIDIAKEDIKSTLIQKMCDQIDNGGTTIGLDIDEIVKEGRYTDLIVRAKKVIDLRKEEMNRVKVTWDVDVWEGRIWGEDSNDGPDKYDLRALWLTAYGYRILRVLGMQQSTDERNLRRIKAACKKIGHDLLVEPSEFQIPTEMSSHLQELILNLVDTH